MLSRRTCHTDAVSFRYLVSMLMSNETTKLTAGWLSFRHKTVVLLPARSSLGSLRRGLDRQPAVLATKNHIFLSFRPLWAVLNMSGREGETSFHPMFLMFSGEIRSSFKKIIFDSVTKLNVWCLTAWISKLTAAKESARPTTAFASTKIHSKICDINIFLLSANIYIRVTFFLDHRWVTAVVWGNRPTNCLSKM